MKTREKYTAITKCSVSLVWRLQWQARQEIELGYYTNKQPCVWMTSNDTVHALPLRTPISTRCASISTWRLNSTWLTKPQVNIKPMSDLLHTIGKGVPITILYILVGGAKLYFPHPTSGIYSRSPSCVGNRSFHLNFLTSLCVTTTCVNLVRTWLWALAYRSNVIYNFRF